MSEVSIPDRADARSRDAVRGVAGSWWLFLILGVLWILFGMFVLSFNVGSLLALAIFAGVTFLLTGVNQILAWGRAEGGWRWLYIIGGALSIIAGIIAFVWPGRTLLVISVMLAWFLVFKGIVDIVAAFSNHGRPYWWIGLILGILELLLGMWAAGYPGRSLLVFVNLLGIYAIFYGFTELFAAFDLRGLGRRLDRLPPAPDEEAFQRRPAEEPGDVTEVDGQVLSFVVEEHAGDPAPCLLDMPFTGVFQAGDALPGNLLEGDRLVPGTDIAEQGLATQWLVLSTTVELSAIDGDERVQVAEAAAGDHTQWMATFPLLIPRYGTVAARLRCTARSAPEGRLDVQIRVDGELYRTLAVRLAVAEPEAAPAAPRPDPAEPRRPDLEAPASVAPVAVIDTVVVPAAQTGLRPSADWQTPSQRLRINLFPPFSTLQSDDLGLNMSEQWNPQPAVIQRHIANLQRSLDAFRAEFSDALDDIEPTDLAERLAAYPPRGWPTAPRAAEDARHAAWSMMAASDALRQVAGYGRDLYDELLPEGLLHREAVERLAPGARLDLDWFHDGSAFWVAHVPWSLLYSGDPADDVDAHRFLGLRLRIANTTHSFHSPTRALGPPGAATRAHLVYWGTGDPTGEVATLHRGDLERWGPVLPLPTTEDRKAELKAFLKRPAPPPVSVIYLFCQCRAGDGAQPELRFGSTNSARDVLSILDLGRDPFDSQPLVFLNACDTAKAEPYFVNELESRFFRRQARAFIGTESKVPIRFAASFATTFFHFLYQRAPGAAPTPAGEAFAQARAFFWDQYANPGGLLYAYVNDFNLYAARDDEVASLRGA